MKKSSLLVLMFFIISLSGIYADTPFFELNGKIKSYTRTNYVISQRFGDYFRTPDIRYTYNFDEKGLELERLEVNANGVLLSKVTNTYDENGLISSVTSTDGTNVTEWRIEYKYDEEGRVIDVSEKNKNDVLTGRTITKYSEDKTRVEESYYNGEGQLKWKNIYKYEPETNRKLELCQYFDTGVLDQRLTYIYSDEGQLMEVDTTDENGKVTKKTLYRFKDGKNTETATYNFINGTEEREFYRYDESDGNLVRIATYNVASKFDTIVNELIGMSEFEYTK